MAAHNQKTYYLLKSCQFHHSHMKDCPLLTEDQHHQQTNQLLIHGDFFQFQELELVMPPEQLLQKQPTEKLPQKLKDFSH